MSNGDAPAQRLPKSPTGDEVVVVSSRSIEEEVCASSPEGLHKEISLKSALSDVSDLSGEADAVTTTSPTSLVKHQSSVVNNLKKERNLMQSEPRELREKVKTIQHGKERKAAQKQLWGASQENCMLPKYSALNDILSHETGTPVNAWATFLEQEMESGIEVSPTDVQNFDSHYMRSSQSFGRNSCTTSVMPVDDIEAVGVNPYNMNMALATAYPLESDTTFSGPKPPASPPLKIIEKKETCGTKLWSSFISTCTFLIPDSLICRKNDEAKQAWREKVAFCVIVLIVSLLVVGGLGVFPLLYCQEKASYTWHEIRQKNNAIVAYGRGAWIVVHGIIYDLKPFMKKHPGGSGGVERFVDTDASKLFPRMAAKDLPSWCLNPVKRPMDLPQFFTAECTEFTEEDRLEELPCHDSNTATENIYGYRGMSRYYKGILAFSGTDLLVNNKFTDWIVIDKRVYNVSSYTRHIKNNVSYKLEANHNNSFLTQKLNNVIVNKINQDATKFFKETYPPDIAGSYLSCLEDLYFAGVLKDRGNTTCYVTNIIMLIGLILVLAIIGLQLLCSLLFVGRGNNILTEDMARNQVMVMIPCYNEGDKELRKTINSIFEADYPGGNKIIFVVADGLITGHGENISTPEIVASVLGYKMNNARDQAYLYSSTGTMKKNRAYVYSGIYQWDRTHVKYIVVVKCGVTGERKSIRAGNRGKRDSQLILAGLFNRIHYGRDLCELDIVICRTLSDLGVSMESLKYLLMLDADTRMHHDALAQMVCGMEEDSNILALCGETRVDNKAQSWVSMIQVYEYFASHHMKKAFEAAFGCVTCLPGCFTIYRIKCNENMPLIGSDKVYGKYSRNDIESLHEKNLYLLGEDRMLTTLLLKYHSNMKLSFAPTAICWTIVPHTFWVLLSQRRRWINSTFHNMWELMQVKTLCGMCCLSMKTVVIWDMISIMVLPAFMVYAGYFICMVIVAGETISRMLIIAYIIIIGSQVRAFGGVHKIFRYYQRNLFLRSPDPVNYLFLLLLLPLDRCSCSFYGLSLFIYSGS